MNRSRRQVPGQRYSQASPQGKVQVLVSALHAVLALGGIGWALAAQVRESRADTVRILHHDLDALQARAELIQQARDEINVASYVIGDGRVPLSVFALLRDAARRGVTVRVIVDGHRGNNLISPAVLSLLKREGVEIREFRRDGRNRPDLGLQHMHDKLLVVDGMDAITGGRNLADEYFGVGERGGNFVDRDVHVSGYSAAAARAYFLDRWATCSPVVPCAGVASDSDRSQPDQAVERLDAALAWFLPQGLSDGLPDHQRSLQGTHHELVVEQATSVSPARESRVEFLHDVPGGSKQDAGSIGPRILELLAAAQRSIILETPYLVMSHRLKHVLRTARSRGISVCILTNSLETNNQLWAHAAYADQRRWMRRHGIELHELKGGDHLHAKAAVIDDATAIIGSYNFDPLSEKINSEVAILVHDPAVSAGLAASIREHMERSLAVPSRGNLIGWDARTNSVDRGTLATFRRRRLIAPVIKPFL